MDTIERKKRTRVRAYSPEFKARLVAESEQTGASVAQGGTRAWPERQLLHTWRREARGNGGSARRKAEFVPLPLPTLAPSSAAAIRIELRDGATSISVAWPMEAADACAAWMRELLR